MPRVSRFEVFQMRELRIDQEACRGRESRSLGDLRQSRNAERTANADRPSKDAGRKIGQSGELTRSPGEDYAAARFCRKRGGNKAIARDLQNLLGTRLDDAG